MLNSIPRRDEANIGTFKRSGTPREGMEPPACRKAAAHCRGTWANDDAASHRVYVGRVEINGAWSKRSSEGRDYLAVKLGDPSLNAPIYANLVEDQDGESYTLIWSRSRKPDED